MGVAYRAVLIGLFPYKAVVVVSDGGGTASKVALDAYILAALGGCTAIS